MRAVDLEYGGRTPISGVELCRYSSCLLGGPGVSEFCFFLGCSGWRRAVDQKVCAPGAYSACWLLPCHILSAGALVRPGTLVY